MAALETLRPDVLHDPDRLDAVRATGLLDTPVEESFDRLTRLASKLTGAPVTFLSLVDENRDFYKSCFGFPEPLASDRQLEGTTFCHYAIRSDGPLVIDDTRAHPVYRNVPTVQSLGVSAYLGIPLVTSEGRALGSFCAIDFQPHAWRPIDVEIMTELAASTLREIELRAASRKSSDDRRLLEAAINQMPAGVIIAAPDGTIVMSNARAKEMATRKIENLFKEGPESERWPLLRAIRNGETIENEPWTQTMPGGAIRHLTISAAPVRDGELIAGVVTFHDVTAERRATEERLQILKRLDEERNRLSTVLENVPAAVIFAEAPSGRIVMGNRQTEELFGHPVIHSDDVSAYGEWVAFHPDGRPVQPQEWPLARALEGETVRGEDFLYQRPDGRRVWIRVHGAPVRDAAGTIVGSVIAAHDIDEARRANQAKDDFFAALTHELRTPMTAIIGWSRLLKIEGMDNPDLVEAAEMIESSARVQARLVDDLLDVSRIAAGKIVLARQPLDLNLAIEEAMGAAEPSAQAQGVRLRKTLAEVPPIDADHARLRQIFGNLLSNAIKFTPSGGLIEVTSTFDGERVTICVRDSGRGIPAELLPHIFERGTQARNAEQGGLGLGLTIVKHLVEMHGGTIRAESEGAGKGATFVVVLPVRASG